MRLTLEEKKKNEGPPSAPEAAMMFLATLVGEFIRWWREDFYIYVAGAYERVDAGYIAHLVREFVVDTWGAAEADHEYVKAVVETIKQARYTDSRWEQPFGLDGTKVGDCFVLDNGTLHLDKMLTGGQLELLPHNPNLFSLGRACYSFDPSALAPLFEAFLEWMTKGCKRTRQLMLELMFYCLVRLQYQIFSWQVGCGANGKSVFLHLLRHFLGDNSISAVPLQRLGTRFQNTSLLGKRANIACDVAEVSKDHLARIRQLADGSPVEIERKFRDSVHSIIQARLFFASNTFPPISDRTNGTWRRLILIPAEAVVQQEIPQYEKQLIPELPGILNLVLKAVRRLDRAWPLRRSRTVPTCEGEVQARTGYLAVVLPRVPCLREGGLHYLGRDLLLVPRMVPRTRPYSGQFSQLLALLPRGDAKADCCWDGRAKAADVKGREACLGVVWAAVC